MLGDFAKMDFLCYHRMSGTRLAKNVQTNHHAVKVKQAVKLSTALQLKRSLGLVWWFCTPGPSYLDQVQRVCFTDIEFRVYTVHLLWAHFCMIIVEYDLNQELLSQTFPPSGHTHILLLAISLLCLWLIQIQHSWRSAHSLACFRVRALSLDCWGLLLHSAPWLHRPPACNSYSHQAPSDSLSAEQTLSAELQRQSARWKAEQKHQQRHHRAHLIIARAKKQQTVCLSWERILHGTLWQTKPAFCASPLPVPISKRLDILLFQGLTILFYHSLMIGNTTKSKLKFELFAMMFGPHME